MVGYQIPVVVRFPEIFGSRWLMGLDSGVLSEFQKVQSRLLSWWTDDENQLDEENSRNS